MNRKYAITVEKNGVTITLLITNVSIHFAENEVIYKLQTMGLVISFHNIIKVENIEDVS